MPIRVTIIGYNLVGKRIADAVARQADMVLVGILEEDPQVRRMIGTMGLPLLESEESPPYRESDVAVLCCQRELAGDMPIINASCLPSKEGTLYSPLTPAESLPGRRRIQIGSADGIGLARLAKTLSSLATIERLYANIITRSGHATQTARGSIDSLELLPTDGIETDQLAATLAPVVGRFHLSRVRAPVTHSNLHRIQLDLDRPIERQAVLEVMRQTPRIWVARAAEGFATTADIREFVRNMERWRPDRPELFVWEESVMSDRNRVYLMADVCPEAMSIPETIDAIRLSRGGPCDLAESIRQTDAALGIGRFQKLFRTGFRSEPAAVSPPIGEKCPSPDSIAGPRRKDENDRVQQIRRRTNENPVRVAVLGYGVIGRRVADAVRAQPDMELTGICGRPTSWSLRDAQLLSLPVYATTPPRPGDVADRWCRIRGTLEDLLSQCDVLLDCTPGGIPASYGDLYDRFPERTVIVQGGEKHAFGDVSFNAFANYAEAAGEKRLRVISCSSTGTARLLFALQRTFGVERASATLARRAADPAKTGKTPTNALRPTMGQSHHAADVRTVLPGLDIFSVSVDVPTTFGHLIHIQADLRGAPAVAKVVESLNRMPRVRVGRGLRSTADLAEHSRDLGRSRRDRPEIYVWQESITVVDQTVYAAISVHMESITIPETVDCIRAALELEPDPWASIARTDRALGIEKDATCYRREAT